MRLGIAGCGHCEERVDAGESAKMDASELQNWPREEAGVSKWSESVVVDDVFLVCRCMIGAG